MSNIFADNEILTLRNIEKSDAKLIAIWKDDNLTRKMSVGFNTTITNENQLIDIRNSINSDYDDYYIIELKIHKKPIGYIRINWLVYMSINFVYFLSK